MPTFLTAYKHLGCAAVLLLGLSSCEQQQQAKPVSTAPLPQMQAARYYLNAKPSTKEVIEQLDTKYITRMEVLDGQKAATYAQDPDVKRVILAQTK
ncbi:hypothetical protein [Hymenobacter sp. BT559]|uniref:hypothetical protein n=1 Tax=Hymenobacter sp. BT559 TaxID=2795729 RepID=UPI0018ED2AAA|nr:hypothetical protein [Hymenobacter sp. BT559]MBJ6143995.1 hypothetical protein [Hymenobacter sp. BT559]